MMISLVNGDFERCVCVGKKLFKKMIEPGDPPGALTTHWLNPLTL